MIFCVAAKMIVSKIVNNIVKDYSFREEKWRAQIQNRRSLFAITVEESCILKS